VTEPFPATVVRPVGAPGTVTTAGSAAGNDAAEAIVAGSSEVTATLIASGSISRRPKRQRDLTTPFIVAPSSKAPVGFGGID
jgi:hypothetical protein